MRRLLCIIALAGLLSPPLTAQNLVPNPSFETLTGCPPGNSGLGQGYCPPWQRPPGSITTPDLFHSCSSAGTGCGNCNVPSNFGGVSNAFHGVAYAGLITYYTGCPNCREYSQVQLTSALTGGQAYEVRFRVKLGPYSRYGTNRIALHLSNSAISQPSNQPISLTPSVEYPGQILDKTNWTLVKAIYMASGGERWITIGSFYNNAGTNVFNFGSSASGCALATAGATYYFDSVYVGSAVALPAALNNFSAAPAPEGSLISWTTGNESGTAYFEVEHARAGQVFLVLGRRNAAGYSDIETDYGFLHRDPGPGIHYYRLRVVDQDGKARYSDVAEVRHGEWDGNRLGIELFPNPAKGLATLRLNREFSGSETLRIELFTSIGKRAFFGSFPVDEGQGFEAELNLERLAPGVYLLKASTGRSEGSRLLLIK